MDHLILPALVSPFYKPANPNSLNRFVNKVFQNCGGIAHTIMFESVTFIVYCIIGLILRTDGVVNRINIFLIENQTDENQNIFTSLLLVKGVG